MGSTPPTDSTDVAVLQARAIETLTALARQTRIRGAGTAAATSEPVDFADLATHVLTAVAANVGSVGTLLAGRPGSWEAGHLRRLIEDRAGQDADDLVRWRTEPVRLHFDVVDVFDDFGIGGLYDQEQQQFVDQVNDDTLTDAQHDAAEQRIDAIEQLWQQDQATYTAAFRATAGRHLTDIGATCGIELGAGKPATVWDRVAETTHEYTRRNTPLPMTGSVPDWSDGTPADALRRAGLTYTTRIDAPHP